MTDYDAIAHAYRETKSLPIKRYSEEFTWFQVLGSVHGLAVLDVACGDGYYTRAMKRRGPCRILGIDSSPTMIAYAAGEEKANPLGIGYVVGQAETMDVLGVFDLVTAAYLLVHADSRARLSAMCQAIVKQLRPGGRFVGLTINPQLVPARLPRVEQYHSGVTVQGPLRDGGPLDVTMLIAGAPLHLRNYYWSRETYESVLHQAGFHRIVWHAMQVSPEGFEPYGKTYWQDYLDQPHIVVLEAKRGTVRRTRRRGSG
jgi:ubiquinone/menaquinone biosynthesis C-methylase UbiE